MPKADSHTIDPILERTFGWLRELGFAPTPDRDMTVGATFESDAVIVRSTYHWHDAYVDVTIARRWTPEPAPYWAQVHLRELLKRVPAKGTYDGEIREESQSEIEGVFARAGSLLREVASEQLAGRNLELLDDIVAKRPHRGVPGLDFPVAEPWAASQEGFWFATDFRGPMPIEEAIAASRANDASTRASSALRLLPGTAERQHDQQVAFARLVELLADSDPDVRRAAASSLGQWGEVSPIGAILDLLDLEPGNVASPFAAAATFLAIDQARELRQAVQVALDRFAARGSGAQEQVTKLRWRLDDHPRGYSRIIEVFR